MTSTQNFMHYFLESQRFISNIQASSLIPGGVAFNHGNGNHPKDERKIYPIGSMGLGYLPTFAYIWLIFMVNVGKYTIHGSYGYWRLNHDYGRKGNDLWNPPTYQHQLITHQSKCQLNPIDTRGTPPSNIPPWKFNITPCKMVGLEGSDPFLLGPGKLFRGAMLSSAFHFGRGPGGWNTINFYSPEI